MDVPQEFLGNEVVVVFESISEIDIYMTIIEAYVSDIGDEVERDETDKSLRVIPSGTKILPTTTRDFADCVESRDEPPLVVNYTFNFDTRGSTDFAHQNVPIQREDGDHRTDFDRSSALRLAGYIRMMTAYRVVHYTEDEDLNS